MKMLFCASNALNKWLKADLKRLPVPEGKQAGVNTLSSDATLFSWQVHIIENRYNSIQKTIIACEANSRFIVFIPVEKRMTIEVLTELLLLEWQFIFADTLNNNGTLPNSDIAMLLSKISELKLDISWAKNTDLSINGHTSDAGIWVTQTLQKRELKAIPRELALDLAIYLNSQTKSIKKRKEKFIPIGRLYDYVQQLTNTDNNVSLEANNVISLSEYRNRRK
jgi:hypothetical protein